MLSQPLATNVGLCVTVLVVTIMLCIAGRTPAETLNFRCSGFNFCILTTMPTSPIQVQHIDHITLVVRDVEASRKFYVGLLGMQEVPRPAFTFDGAWFRAGATLIHLIGAHDRSGPAGYPVEVLVRSSRNHHFAFEVEDARDAAEKLKSLGVTLLDDAKLRPDGAVQVFLTDPDHHVVELCTSPKT